ncbi:flagellar basal-body MS-ring/collar protein FliF [Pseudaeromonas sp. ZJS20]|uniref:flagellar basal-body MS-ring/collar protein FliF n=1 Tax=Pseudaeromonas aegiceratis TaxID=3153928 RepID=UPI00390C96BE
MNQKTKRRALDERAGQAKAAVGSLLAQWRSQSRDNRSVLVIALLAALVAASIVVILWTAGQSYVPLYGRQEMYDTANILELLEKDQVPFKLDVASGQVLVPESQLAQVRIRLAAHGVRAAMPAGMEGLEGKVGLGTSEFMETMRYRNALEGELARTIIGLDGVRSARVHLAIPKRTLFVGREEEKPSASVMLDLAAGAELEPGQVEAILNLVAGSVSGMKPDAVTVVDQAGRLLSAQLRQGESGHLSVQQIDYVRRLEDYIRQRAADMLYPMLGSDNFRIQVAADVDFNKVEQTEEAMPGQPVLRSESGKQDNSLDRIAAGIPGALSNRPPQTVSGAGATAPEPQSARNERSEFKRDYVVGRSVTHTQFQQGRLQHLQVSVLLNQNAAPKEGWSADQLTEIHGLVERAVGFVAERGDQISLTSFPFTESAVDPGNFGEAWWQQPLFQNSLRYGMGTLLCLLLVLLGIRPLVNYLVQQHRHERAERDDEALAALPEGLVADGESPVQAPAVVTSPVPAKAAPMPLSVDELPPVGSDLDVQLAHLHLMVEQETARVTEVLKLWVNGQHERN